MIKKFYTRKEISFLLKVSIFTVDSWIKKKKLDCYKIEGIVRISQSDFDAFILSTSLKEGVKNKTNE